MPHQPDSEASTPTGTAAALYEAVAALEDSGAARFDPVRFRYIQGMAKRSRQQDDAVASLVVEKAWEALRAYQSSFDRESAAVEALLEKLAQELPHMTEHLENLFQSCDFKAIRRLAGRRQEPETVDSFAALIHQLQSTANDRSSEPTNNYPELKALQHHRDALRQQHAERLVSHALKDAPEGAGPLNPQKLALRSLAIMHDISPAYLGQFVSWAETLFWLEQHKHS